LRNEFRAIIVGAAVGALLGALGGWLYRRYGPQAKNGEAGSSALVQRSASLDRGKVMRLGVALVGVIRQLVDLDG